MDPYAIIKYPLSTEKTVRLMESENKLTFVVNSKSKKQEIKQAIQELFKVKVVKVTTINTSKGVKKAYIKLSSENKAIDVATQLGLI
ncbi:MAG: 50S ribosomal protein L23 [Candidatus Woesearchaeota archaeon]|nr:50S ribosomal protein L23 [Candidatus Woesearchaeota archaeon]